MEVFKNEYKQEKSNFNIFFAGKISVIDYGIGCSVGSGMRMCAYGF